jgi:hypothetical protein
MSARLESGVERRIRDPSPGVKVTLIVDLSVADSASVTDTLESVGGATTVEEPLPFGSAAVTTVEEELEALADLDIVDAIEIEGGGRVLSSGNL